MQFIPVLTADIDFPEFDQHDDGWDDDEQPFRPFRGRMPLAPIRLVAAANALVSFGEALGDAGSPLRGAFVDLLLGEMHCAPQSERERVPCDTAFVSHVGYWAGMETRPGASRVGRTSRRTGSRDPPVSG